MKQYGIIGYPIEHTLSPFFHTTLFQQYGIDASYLPFSILEQEIPHYMEELRTHSLFGLSVTAPYKYIVASYCDVLSPLAKATGVVNTLTVREGKIYGDNFDIAGIIKTLQSMQYQLAFQAQYRQNEMNERELYSGRTACILGTGATAVSAIVALRCIGVQTIYIVGRKKETLYSLQEKYSVIPVYYTFDIHDIPQEGLDFCLSLFDIPFCSYLITTIQKGDIQLISYDILTRLVDSSSIVFDVHYSPRYSALLHDALRCTCYVSNGYRMFIVQAMLQFVSWTSLFPTQEEIDIITTYYNTHYT